VRTVIGAEETGYGAVSWDCSDSLAGADTRVGLPLGFRFCQLYVISVSSATEVRKGAAVVPIATGGRSLTQHFCDIRAWTCPNPESIQLVQPRFMLP
jgi:hypothetical protein